VLHLDSLIRVNRAAARPNGYETTAELEVLVQSDEREGSTSVADRSLAPQSGIEPFAFMMVTCQLSRDFPQRLIVPHMMHTPRSDGEGGSYEPRFSLLA